MKIKTIGIIKKCSDYAIENNFKSYDIFDALTCSWINNMTKNKTFFKRVAIQLNAKSPIDLHWFGMQQMQHTKLFLILSGYFP